MQPRLFRLTAAIVAVAGFLASAPRASAELITLNYQGQTTNPGNPTLAVTLGSTTYTNTPVGPFYWNQNQIPPNSNFPSPISTFCIEIDNSQPLPPIGTNTVFSVVSPAAATTINSTAKADAIAELYGRYYNLAWSDKTTFHGSVQSAAFQLALWELVYDGPSNKNLTAGNFKAPGLVDGSGNDYTATAQAMLNSLNGSNAFAQNLGGYELVALLAPARTDPTKPQDMVQDQLILRPKGVPAPPAALLAGVGVLALIGRSRLIRRAPTA